MSIYLLDYEEACRAVRANPSDREVVLSALHRDGRALEYAAAAFQCDRAIVLEAVKGDGRAFEFAADALRADPRFVLEAVTQHGWALKHATADLRAHRGIVLEAVRSRGSALEYAAAELRADRDIAFEAATQNILALDHAPAELRAEFRADREMVLAAVDKRGGNFDFVAKEFGADREVVLAAVRRDPDVLQYASEALQRDPELQPDRAAANPLAVPGTAAPLVLVEGICPAPGGGVEAQARLASGRTAVLQLPEGATIGDLAREAVAAFGFPGGNAHVHWAGRPVGPFDERKPLLCGPSVAAAGAPSEEA